MIAAAPRERAREDAVAFASDALATIAARAPEDAIARVTVAAPVADPLALPGLASLWEPPRGPILAGAGAAATIRASGVGRFAAVRAQADALWPRVIDVAQAGVGGVPARLVGGFAFAAGDADGAWSAFGDALFCLPRLGYVRDGDRAWLSVAAPVSRRDEAVDDLAAALAALARGVEPAPAVPGLRRIDELDTGRWRRRVEAIRAGIASGEVEKVVAARRSSVALDGAVDPLALLARLRRRHRGCYRFAHAAGDGVFLGASPERLIARRGARVDTEALAGSIAADADVAALLGSAKDRGEQAVVVRAIADALAPLCAELEVPDAPRPRALRDVVHLETPIGGTLRRPTHVLELVEALHPTPAVGGVPRDRALAWIAEAEEHGRGWYAGPVGWLDAEGDGEFAVAIRSGLVAGDRAYLYAGAGIVADSAADAEYAETGLKQRALLDALGVLG